jgi:hypothetical protein
VFLSSWLPVEERRRWKRATANGETPVEESGAQGLSGTLSRWIKGDAEKAPDHPTTRASDHVVHLDFDKRGEDEVEKRTPRLQPHPSKNQGR